jgi:hypothetical protein
MARGPLVAVIAAIALANRLVLRATDAAGNGSTARRLAFTVVAGR